MGTNPIPSTAPDGLYWYMVPGQDPEPVLINRARYGDRMKAFNGREQAWLRDSERLVGPIAPPASEPNLQLDEGAVLLDRVGFDPRPLHQKLNPGTPAA